MESLHLIDSLERFADLLPVVVAGIPPADFRWQPDRGVWSVLEIVCHLADEEVEDFRTRLELTLRDPSLEWPPIDPEATAAERRSSVTWLRSLGAVDWSKKRSHPRLGDLRAGDLLASWAAHDLLHLRQLAKRRFQLIQRDAGDYGTGYAGEWTL